MEISWQETLFFRTRIYQFLAYCLLEPSREENCEPLQPKFWLDFPLAPANEIMENALQKLIECTELFSKNDVSETLLKVQLEYMTLFVGPADPKAPPWESLYRCSEGTLFGAPTILVREAMKEFGFEIAAKYQQPEDHLGLELMLLAVASEQAAELEDEAYYEQLQRQADFILAHPLSWVHDLEERTMVPGTSGFYTYILRLISGVLMWDSDLLAEQLNHPKELVTH